MHISRDGHVVTLINVFETEPGQQQALIDSWIAFVEGVKDETDLIAAALHRSKDGTRVINYAQWRSETAYGRFVEQYSEQFAARLPLASRVDPHLYEVVYLHDRAGE
jgi:quinol monooxygenase YgiN